MNPDRRAAGLLLALLSGLFLVFAFFFVPRLNNNVMGDMEFTGWTGPFAARLARGERPYVGNGLGWRAPRAECPCLLGLRRNLAE